MSHDGEAGSSWLTLDAHPIAVAGYDFEGMRLQTPVMREVDGSYKPLKGLSKAGMPVSMAQHDGRLLVCASSGPKTIAHVYEAAKGYEEVWSHEGQCPVFWPLE